MATDSVIAAAVAFLRRHPPFDHMDEGLLQALAGELSMAYFPAGAVVLAPDSGPPQHLYIVQRGLVQLQPAEGYHVLAGGVVTLEPGECFSVYALMEKRAVASPYIAASDTFCYRLPAAGFERLLDRSPRFREFSTDYLRSLLRDSRRLIRMHGASAAAEQQAMNQPLQVLIERKPVYCTGDTPVKSALSRMHEARVGSIVVVDAERRPIGIFTRHDVLDRVALAERALDTPIAEVMTRVPFTLESSATANDAALLIARRGLRHVPVTQHGVLSGVITERDLFSARRVTLHGVHRVIASADGLEPLAQAGRDVRALVERLYAQGVGAEHLTRLITTLNDTLTQRVITVVAARHELHGLRWCWLAFGSEGREEQTVSTDQDNGLIFEGGTGEDDSQVAARLLPFAREVNHWLSRCGFPLCSGNIMAGNPQWCLSLDGWRRQFDGWVRNTSPEALLNSVIFFDFRALHGDASLAQALRVHLNALTRGNARFLRQLAQYALEVKPPLGIISDFVLEKDAAGEPGLDLKKYGARVFVDAARVFALAAGAEATHSAARLRGAADTLKLDAMEVASAVDAFHFIQQLRLRAQLTDSGKDRTQANRVNPVTLSEIDRRILKESLRQARRLQERLALDYSS
jgi:CBS domain-containing protein